jgi:hypothetical protein
MVDDKEDILTAQDRKHKGKTFSSLGDEYEYLDWFSPASECFT